MAWQLKFGNDVIVSNLNGTFSFQRGSFAREWVFKRLPRMRGEIAKETGLQGADHRVEVTYTNVDSGDVESIFEDLDELVATSGIRTLVIPRQSTGEALHTIPNCVLRSVEPGEQALRALDLAPGDLNGTEAWDLDFVLTFRQIRR